MRTRDELAAHVEAARLILADKQRDVDELIRRDQLQHGDDPAMASGITRSHRKGAKIMAQRDASMQRMATAYRELKAAEQALRVAQYRLRNAPVPFTREELEAARVIRTAIGWEGVLQVNAKTVKVSSEPGWRSISQILEVRV